MIPKQLSVDGSPNEPNDMLGEQEVCQRCVNIAVVIIIILTSESFINQYTILPVAAANLHSSKLSCLGQGSISEVVPAIAKIVNALLQRNTAQGVMKMLFCCQFISMHVSPQIVFDLTSLCGICIHAQRPAPYTSTHDMHGRSPCQRYLPPSTPLLPPSPHSVVPAHLEQLQCSEAFLT